MDLFLHMKMRIKLFVLGLDRKSVPRDHRLSFVITQDANW